MERSGRKRDYHPRRFDGCVQCKKLKVKCSRDKPTCRRCQRLNGDCVYSDIKVWTVTRSQPNASSSKPASKDIIRAVPQSQQDISLIAPDVLYSPTSVFSSSMQASGVHIQLVQELYDSIIPYEEITPQLDQINWFETVISHPQKGLALGQILKAMALKRFAFLHNDTRIDQAGSRAYIAGLRIIQSKLSRELTTKGDDLIAAVRAAYTYEQLFTSNERTSVSSHWLGLQQLAATGKPKEGWGKLGRISIRSTLMAQGLALLRDASGGSMTPLLANAIHELDAVDTTDAIRLNRSVDMIRLISLGETIRLAQRKLQQNEEISLAQLQKLETEIERAENTIYKIFPQSTESYVAMMPQSDTDVSNCSLDQILNSESNNEQPTTISSSQSNAVKRLESCFFNLWLADLLNDFITQTGVQLKLPAATKWVDPAYHTALSLGIVRAYEQSLNGPRSVLLAVANSYPLCLAHKILARLAPHLTEYSNIVMEKSILTGNGALRSHMNRVAIGDMPGYF